MDATYLHPDRHRDSNLLSDGDLDADINPNADADPNPVSKPDTAGDPDSWRFRYFHPLPFGDAGAAACADRSFKRGVNTVTANSVAHERRYFLTFTEIEGPCFSSTATSTAFPLRSKQSETDSRPAVKFSILTQSSQAGIVGEFSSTSASDPAT